MNVSLSIVHRDHHHVNDCNLYNFFRDENQECCLDYFWWEKKQIWGPSSISKYDAMLFDIFMNFLESTDSNRFGQYSMNIFISFLSDILVVVGFAGELIRI